LIFVAPTDGNPSLPRSSPAATARLTENFDIFAETLGHNVKSALFGEIRLYPPGNPMPQRGSG
jgi:hypothetical protein